MMKFTECIKVNQTQSLLIRKFTEYRVLKIHIFENLTLYSYNFSLPNNMKVFHVQFESLPNTEDLLNRI